MQIDVPPPVPINKIFYSDCSVHDWTARSNIQLQLLSFCSWLNPLGYGNGAGSPDISHLTSSLIWIQYPNSTASSSSSSSQHLIIQSTQSQHGRGKLPHSVHCTGRVHCKLPVLGKSLCKNATGLSQMHSAACTALGQWCWRGITGYQKSPKDQGETNCEYRNWCRPWNYCIPLAFLFL